MPKTKYFIYFILSVMVILSLLNSALHLHFTEDIHQTINFIFVIFGCGLFLPTRLFYLISAFVISLIWLLLIQQSPNLLNMHWHYSYALFTSILLAYIVLVIRLNSYVKIQGLFLRNQAILKAIPDMMFVLDKDGVCLQMEVGDAIPDTHLSGGFIGKNIYEIESQSGQGLQSLISQEIVHLHYTENNLFEDANLSSFEYQLELDKETYNFEARCALLGDDTVLAIVRDVTSKKSIEKELVRQKNIALKKSQTKSLFISNMSHEIRTPLNAVLGLTEILLDTKLRQEQKKYLKIIQNSGENLLHLINDVLDFSKIEAGELVTERSELNLLSIVDEVMQIFAPAAHSKNIFLRKEMSPELNPEMIGDAYRIKQILSNLISNAIKFTDLGGVTLSVTEAPSKQRSKNLRIHFSVEDSGKGISKADQKLIFSQYIQTNQSFVKNREGTGLGLSICKMLVQKMGGGIGVKSSLEKKPNGSGGWGGSIFWFWLPLKPVKREARHERVLFRQFRAVLIDDSYRVDPFLLSILEELGLAPKRIQEVSGLDLSRKDILFFINTSFSNADAFQLVKEWKQKYPALLVVMYSPLKMRGDRERSKRSKANLYLPLPVSKQMLQEAIQQLLRHNMKPLKKRAKKTKLNKSQGRVLVVEDDHTNQLLMKTMLEKRGVHVSLASNGEEAVRIVELEKHDLIFMDITMPAMDGYETTKEIRKKKIKTPIIACTAHAFDQDRNRSSQAGMNDFVSKPYRNKDILRVLNRWITH